jgi:hypothetical protein
MHNIIKQGNLLFDKNIVAIDDEAMQALKGRKWTGHVIFEVFLLAKHATI